MVRLIKGVYLGFFGWGLSLGFALIGCDEPVKSVHVGSADDDSTFDQTGAWEAGAASFTRTFYVRPPGQAYGLSDGTSWENAFSGLPERRKRGSRYLFATGEYHPADLTRVETYLFDDAEENGAYIWLIKATEADHGDDVGWDDASMGQGAATFGALSFVTGHYILDGRTGDDTGGYGFHIYHRDCEERAISFIASPIYFPSLSLSAYISIRRAEIQDCGNQADPTVRAQDAVYAVDPVSHFVFAGNYVRDAWRNHLFMQGAVDVLIEDNYFARSGLHEESNAIALRESRNIVIARNFMIDSVNCFVNLEWVRNVTISSNVFTHSTGVEGWDNWAAVFSQEPALNVLIAGNTFHSLSGLNTGIRFTGETEALLVVNNLWSANRTNQIMLNGTHRSNAFWDNRRVLEAEPVSLDSTIKEKGVQVLTADPFVNAAGYDLRLLTRTNPGEVLAEPFVGTDHWGRPRVNWDRGAFEWVE